MATSSLPVDEALPRLKAALAEHNAAVLVAPPGAGKTTRVPLALLDAPWLGNRKIIMQEPRRLAARAAARRMAATLGEQVGETVGYRVRLDSKVGPRTRIEVVTDGLFLRLLQDDPSLEGVGCVIFDELHERGLESDLAFALVRESQSALREGLRVIAMSATLDPGPVSQRLGGAPLVESAGRMFPVETRYLDREPIGRIEDTMASAIRSALATESGSTLVFLPGVGEIRRVEERLQGLVANIDVAPLYGDLSPAEQDRAIAPSPAGRRKVVLATSIAETSLTIEGVRLVIDGGLMRVPRFSPRSGMMRLETVRASQASADQRRGRAGRLEPGICYRLWTEEAQRGLLPFTPPEILDADLAPLALELAAWGVADAATLPWLTPPPAAALASARELLLDLGAIDPSTALRAGAITPHGRAMVRLGQHPRLAHLVIKGRELGQGRVAALLAAILSERDFLHLPPGQRDVDLRHRVDIALSGKRDGALRLIQESARRLTPREAKGETPDLSMTGALLALAYPDRIGRRRGGAAGRYVLSGGSGAVLPEGDPMANDEFLVVGDLDGSAQDSRIFLAAPITAGGIEALYAERIVAEQVVEWSAREGAVLARQRRRLGALSSKISRSPSRMRRNSRRPCWRAYGSSVCRPCPGATICEHGVSGSPSCAVRMKAGPISPTRYWWRRSRNGWGRTSTACRAAIISPASILLPRSGRSCHGSSNGGSTNLRRPISRCRAVHGLPSTTAIPPSRRFRCVCRRCSASPIRRGSATRSR
jgi:ATP-dependent helicase HrpB